MCRVVPQAGQYVADRSRYCLVENKRSALGSNFSLWGPHWVRRICPKLTKRRPKETAEIIELFGTAGWTRTTDLLIHSLKYAAAYRSSDSGGVSSGCSGPSPSSRSFVSSNSVIVISPGAAFSIASTVTVSTVEMLGGLPSRPGEFHPDSRSPEVDDPPPVPTERGVRLSRTTLFGSCFTAPRALAAPDEGGTALVAVTGSVL